MSVSGPFAAFCDAQNVTYEHRVYNPDALNWCPVPGGGADALLFAGLAVFCSCALYSKLSAVWVLMAGALFQLFNFHYNLNHFSNAITIWLGMHPSTIFFQIFLPPLLLDSAVRVDFFLFKKMAAHCLLFAFFNVVVSTLAFIPLMLYGLGLASAGWRPVDAALFGAMLGSTDAVAVTAILKAGGAPEMLSVLLEGESLFNDASSIVLFEIFLKLGKTTGVDEASLLHSLGHIVKLIGWLAVSGSLAGILMGVVTRLVLKLLHRKHVPPPVEVAVSLAGAYTVYLCTEYYIHGSGVIAVVVYGLYGASSFLWGFSSKGMRQQSFFKFWDVVSFVTNGMVFFFVGTSVTNFLLSLTGELFESGSAALMLTIRCLPAIIIAMFGLRWLLMTLEAPLLSLVGPALNWKEVLFSALGGLRGGLALILAQTVLAAHGTSPDPILKVVHAEMVIWVAAVVLFTLTVNASLLGPLMSVLGLNKVTPAQKLMHRRAYAALAQYTRAAIADLQADDDEMLSGVDWEAVALDSNIGKAVKKVLYSADSSDHQSAEPLGDSYQPHGVLNIWPRRTNTVDCTFLSENTSDAALGNESVDGRVPLTRASLACSSTSFSRLTVPLLGRQYGAKRLGQEGDDESATLDNAPDGDLETGGVHQHVPGIVAESNSEAVFIASRLHEQDEQLAQHAADAEHGPLLANAHAESNAATISTTNTSSSADDTDNTITDQTLTAEEMEAGSADGDVEDWNAADESPEAAAVAQRTGSTVPAFRQGKAKCRLLCPLIVVRMTDAMAALQASSQLNMKGSYGHTAAQQQASTPAAPAASPFAAKSSTAAVAGGIHRPRSFISAVAATARNASTRTSISTSTSSTASYSKLAAANGSSRLRFSSNGQHRTGSGLLSWGSTGLGRPKCNSSAQLLSSVWNQHVATQPGNCRSPERIGPAGPEAYISQPSSAGTSTRALQPSGLDSAVLQPCPLGVLGHNTTLHSMPRVSGHGLTAEGVLLDAGRLLQDLDAMSDGSSDDGDMAQEELLEESRVSLLAGLKRHFRFKAAEGLLSKTSLRLLDYACDACLSHPQRPLDLWTSIGRDFQGQRLTSVMAALHLQLRCYQTALLRATSGPRAWTGNDLERRLACVLVCAARNHTAGHGGCLLWLLQPILNKTSLMLRNRLGVTALTMLEVALELWLSLTASPQARMTRHGTSLASAMLAEELQQQADAVWRFIMDRQIEAPDEFASLQTHRVSLAIARRQLAFVEQLTMVGAVEEAAAEALQEMVEKRLNRLERRGPSWRSPSLIDILRRQPFLAEQSESMLLWLRAYGELKAYNPGQCMVPAKRAGPLGIFIVLSGLVKVDVLRCGQQTTHFVGVGGSVGFLGSALGKELPGVTLLAAYAQGNALGKGPLVLHLPMRLLATIKQRAAPALPASQQRLFHNPTTTSYIEPGLDSSSSRYHSALGSPRLQYRSELDNTTASAGFKASPLSLNATAFAQLLLDMHRQAGVMLLDRMAASVTQQVAAHIEAAVQAIFEYATQLPPAKVHAKLQRLLDALLSSTGNSTTDGHNSSSSSTAAVLNSGRGTGSGSTELQQAATAEAAMQLIEQRASSTTAALRALLHEADLVNLLPGQQIAPESTMFLLLGCLRLSNSASSADAAGPANPTAKGTAVSRSDATAADSASSKSPHNAALRQFNAPTLLAWAPELFEQFQDRYQQHGIIFTAGPRGALLLVTPGDAGSSSSGSEAGEAVAADDDKQQVTTEQQHQDVDMKPMKQQCGRLSSALPLHRTVAHTAVPDQDG